MLHTLRRRLTAATLPAAIALACGLAQTATAMTVALPTSALQLDIYRDGTPTDWLAGNQRWLSDSFDNGIATTGPVGVSYSLQGLANPADAPLAAAEAGGALQLDASYGALAPNAAGQLGRSVRLRLASDTTGTTGLSREHSFAAVLRLSLTGLPTLGQTFGFRLSDGFSNSNDFIELYVAGSNTGTNIVFRKQDFLSHQITALTSVPLPSVVGAQALVLILSHDTAGSDSVDALFSFADASGALMSDVFLVNGTSAFRGETTTQLELRASTTLAVPEPGSWALMALGLGFLGFMGGRLKRRAA